MPDPQPIREIVSEEIARLARCSMCDGPYCEMHAYQMHTVGCPDGGTEKASECPKLHSHMRVMTEREVDRG